MVPPLYPIVIALTGGGLGQWEPVRWLSVLLYAANTFVFGSILSKLTRGSVFFTLMGTSLIACSLVSLEIHTAAWSEPLFLLLLQLAICALAGYLEKPCLKRLLLCSVLVGLSPLCRFAGVTVLAASWLVIILFGDRGRWKEWVFFGAFTVTPFLSLALWNRSRYPVGAEGGGFNPHFPSQDLLVLANTVSAWILPGIDPI